MQIELNIAVKFIERLLKQHESPDGSRKFQPLPPPDNVVDQQEEVVPDFFEFGDQQESSNEDQDESSPKEKETEFETGKWNVYLQLAYFNLLRWRYTVCS